MKTRKGRSIIGSVVSVSGIIVLGKLLGLVKQIIAASIFGATIQTDLISISEGLISNMDYLLVQVLITSFVPTYLYVQSEEPNSIRAFVSNCIKMVFILTSGIALIVVFSSPVIARILAPSYSSELSKELAGYIRILAPVIVFVAEMALFNALLKANKSFIPGELMGFNQSVVFIILALAIGKTVGANTIIIAFVSYVVFNTAFLMLFAKKHWSIQKGNPFTDKNIRRIITMIGPLLVGYSLVFINQQVDKMIVSGLGKGTITSMSYAAVLSNFIITFIGSICGVLFTYITQCIVENKTKDAAELAMSSCVQMITVFLPISVLAVANSTDVVKIVLGHGRFDESAINSCSLALFGYSMMFVPVAVRELFSRFQYGYGDSKRPMINSSIAILSNIVLSVAFSRIWGVMGVTVATSISALVCAVLNVMTSKKWNDQLNTIGILRNLPRWLIGTGICIGVSLFGKSILSSCHPIIRFAAIVAISFVLYLLINLPIIKPLIRKLLNRG